MQIRETKPSAISTLGFYRRFPIVLLVRYAVAFGGVRRSAKSRSKM